MNRDTLEHKHRRYFRWGLLLLVGLAAAGIYKLHLLLVGRGWIASSTTIRIADLAGWSILVLGVILASYFGSKQIDLALRWIKAEYSGPEWLRWVACLVFLLLLAVYPLLMFGEYSRYFLLDWTRQAIFAWLAIFASAALAVWQRKSWLGMVPIAAAILAVSYHLATYIPDVSNYPFSLDWSETTRYYVASTLFDRRIYGMDLPLPFRDFTRYLMQAAPFLIKGSPLWVHRLWQAALRFTLTYLAGYVVAKRYKVKGAEWVALFSMWAGLYFFQGPVFYNLIVNAILVFWLVKPDRFWKTMAVVAGISVWAGLSRINWIPMPGLMAAAFYLMEKPLRGKDLKSLVGYLWQPVIWLGAGTLIGLAAQQGYALISGNPAEIYYASFTSFLLWDRLLPNPSYTLGILPHVLLLTLPLITLIAAAWVRWRNRWHWLRPAAVSAIVLALFAGGLLVSVKIGGGTNLHNMDVFLVILLLVAAEIYFSRAVDDKGDQLGFQTPGWLKAAVFVMPIVFIASYSGGMIPERDMAQAERDLAELQAYVDQATADGGEVLFVSQRHLITFGLIDNVVLVHDFEKLLLQEMAMSQNQGYLDDLGLELAEQRFDLIIHDPLPRIEKDVETVALAAENNVVFVEVTPLFECAYQEITRLLDDSLSVLVPKDVATCVQAVE